MKTTRALKEIDDAASDLKRLIAAYKSDVYSAKVFEKRAIEIVYKISHADIEV